MATMNIEEILEQLRKDEGWSSFVYEDTLGFKTIGYGFLIDKNKSGGMPKEIGEYWLRYNVDGVINDLRRRIDFFHRLPDDIQNALVNMAYQLGTNGLLGFKKMLEALKAKNYELAAHEALDSKWSTQTPQRAQRIANLIRYAE